MKRNLGPLVLVLVLLQGATGCIYSEDRSVFESTYVSPKTVFAKDGLTNETIWSYEMPPQTVMAVEFDVASGNAEFVRVERGYPTKMSWELYPIDAQRSMFRKGHYAGFPIESGVFGLEGRPVTLGFTVGQPIDPDSLTSDRSIQEIEQDLPEPDAPAPAPAE